MQVATSAGPGMMAAQRGLVPYTRRDLEAGIRTGRFSVTDLELALGIVVGSALCLGEILRQQPDRDAASSADRMAAAVLRMLGVPADEADRIASAPLPEVTRAGRISARRGGADGVTELKRAPPY